MMQNIGQLRRTPCSKRAIAGNRGFDSACEFLSRPWRVVARSPNRRDHGRLQLYDKGKAFLGGMHVCEHAGCAGQPGAPARFARGRHSGTELARRGDGSRCTLADGATPASSMSSVNLPGEGLAIRSWLLGP
jgi:hypothetical protein